MTRFIDSFATHQLLPPYYSQDSKVHCFFFDIAIDAIQTYCDTFLNIGGQQSRPFFYRPISAAPFGILTFTDYPRLCSRDRATPLSFGVQTGQWDHLHQKELFVAVPVYRYALTSENILVEPEVHWVQPVVILDNATSAFSGREILGIEALYGHVDQITPPVKPEGVSIRVTLPSWQRFAPDSLEELRPFASIDSDAALPGESDEDHRLQSQTLGIERFVDELKAALPALRSYGEGFLPESMQMVMLKQFRDAGDPNLAIHQSLVGARCRYSDIREVRLYDPGAIKVKFTEGAMVDEIISTFLGLHYRHSSVADDAAPSSRALKTRVALSFTATVDLDQIETLFTFRNLSSASEAMV